VRRLGQGVEAKDGGRATPVSQVLKLSVETAPGVVRFDKQRLSAKAGRIAFELTNDKRKGHNIRIHTGDTCCFRTGSKDIGGTRTIGAGRTRVVLDLKPGTYTRDSSSITWKRVGNGKPQQSAAATRGPSLAKRTERQTAAVRSICSRLKSRRSLVRAQYRPSWGLVGRERSAGKR
jgi:hypothetical protein